MKAWKPNKAKPIFKIQSRGEPVEEAVTDSRPVVTDLKTVDELAALKKANLVKHCDRLGVEVPAGATKAELVGLILGAQEEIEAGYEM
jgi:hypothetical protein